MDSYIRVLRERIRDSRYTIDEPAVAEAVLARVRSRRAMDRADARKHVIWLEQQIKHFRIDNRGLAAAAPARSARRATARRASTRRAIARRRQDDTAARIIGFLTRHPESTAGDVAKSLNLDAGSVSMCLAQLAKTGEIKKQAHGYGAQQVPRLRRYRRARPLRH